MTSPKKSFQEKIKSFFKAYYLPMLTGILLGTSYIPFVPWALSFCLVPLWYFWYKNSDSKKKLFIGGWLSQFIFNLIGFHWVAHTATEFGGFPKSVGYIVLILFAAIAHLYYPIAGWLWGYLVQKRKLSSLYSLMLIPLALALCETLYPTIFFWHLGYPWIWANFPGAHMAEWVGFYGLQLITLAINLSLLGFILYRKKSWIVVAALLIILPNLFGFYLKQRYQEGTGELKVLIAQANIGNAVKILQEQGSSFDNYILNKFLKLTDEGLSGDKKVDFILWPETAFPSLVDEKRPSRLQNRLEYFIEAIKTPLITGAYVESPDGKRAYNSMVLFGENGKMENYYHKTHLLAFGEYFPGATYFPKLKKWFPMVSDFGRGDGAKILPLSTKNNETIQLGAQICYESLFDSFSSDLYDKGAQIIVNVTNDSWYGKLFEPYQHLYMTMARAIEFRIPMLRSTNTGISTAISASGKIHPFSPIHEEWSGIFTVNYKKQKSPTLYSYYAGQWHWILLLLCVLVLFGDKIARKP